MATLEADPPRGISIPNFERLIEFITPTSSQVTDWHSVGATLAKDWDRPLVKIMRLLVDPDLPPSDFDLRTKTDTTRGSVITLPDVDLVELDGTTQVEIEPLAA